MPLWDARFFFQGEQELAVFQPRDAHGVAIGAAKQRLPQRAQAFDLQHDQQSVGAQKVQLGRKAQ